MISDLEVRELALAFRVKLYLIAAACCRLKRLRFIGSQPGSIPWLVVAGSRSQKAKLIVAQLPEQAGFRESGSKLPHSKAPKSSPASGRYQTRQPDPLAGRNPDAWYPIGVIRPRYGRSHGNANAKIENPAAVATCWRPSTVNEMGLERTGPPV